MHHIAYLTIVKISAGWTGFVETGDFANHFHFIDINYIYTVVCADVDFAWSCTDHGTAIGTTCFISKNQIINRTDTLQRFCIGYYNAAPSGKWVTSVNRLLRNSYQFISPDGGILWCGSERHSGIFAFINLIHHFAIGSYVVHTAVCTAKPFLVENESAVGIAVFKWCMILILNSYSIGLRYIAAIGRGQGQRTFSDTMSA